MKRATRYLAWLLLACAGCGEEAGTGVVVSGTVTRAGQPVESAKILFRPTNGTKAPVAAAPIEQGRYRIPASDGLRAGSYVVEVSLTRPPKREDPRQGLPKLEAPCEFQREIAGDNAQLDFDL